MQRKHTCRTGFACRRDVRGDSLANCCNGFDALLPLRQCPDPPGRKFSLLPHARSVATRARRPFSGAILQRCSTFEEVGRATGGCGEWGGRPEDLPAVIERSLIAAPGAAAGSSTSSAAPGAETNLLAASAPA